MDFLMWYLKMRNEDLGFPKHNIIVIQSKGITEKETIAKDLNIESFDEVPEAFAQFGNKISADRDVFIRIFNFRKSFVIKIGRISLNLLHLRINKEKSL